MADAAPAAFEIRSIDHVHLAMPAGGEDAARAFYAGLLGFTEAPKPERLADRGGCWFEAGEAKVERGGRARLGGGRERLPRRRIWKPSGAP